jgi:DNA-binding response OmpR family regulator
VRHAPIRLVTMSALPIPTNAAAPVRALVVDAAPEVRLLLEPLLRREGFQVETAPDGTSAVDLARTFDPDVVILEAILPDVDGFDACRRIRAFSDAYIVILSNRSSELDKVIGLSIGADDYLGKPFSANELVARLRAMLRRPRRAGKQEHTVIDADVRSFGPLTVDFDARQVSVGVRPIELTRIEFDLLATLCSRPRQVFTRTQLLESVWGPQWFGDTHVVDVHMSNLRRKLGERDRLAHFVHTVRGVGFRLADELTRAQGAA